LNDWLIVKNQTIGFTISFLVRTTWDPLVLGSTPDFGLRLPSPTPVCVAKSCVHVCRGYAWKRPHVGGRSSLSPPSCAHVCLSRKGFSIELDYLVTELAGSPRSLEVSPRGVCLVGGLPPGAGCYPCPRVGRIPPVARSPPGPQVRVTPSLLNKKFHLPGEAGVCSPEKTLQRRGKSIAAPPWER
jgi:hypothetical protein